MRGCPRSLGPEKISREAGEGTPLLGASRTVHPHPSVSLDPKAPESLGAAEAQTSWQRGGEPWSGVLLSSELLFRSPPPTLLCHGVPETGGESPGPLASLFGAQVRAPNKGGRPRAPSSTWAWSGEARDPRLPLQPELDPDAALRLRWAPGSPPQPRSPRQCLAHFQPQPLQRPGSGARGSSGNWLGGLHQNHASNSDSLDLQGKNGEGGDTSFPLLGSSRLFPWEAEKTTLGSEGAFPPRN